MKSERLLYALGAIADEMVEQAAPLQTAKASWKKLLPMAACAAVVLLVGLGTVQLHEYTHTLTPSQSESITSSVPVSEPVTSNTEPVAPSQSQSDSSSDTEPSQILEIMPESQPITYAGDGLQVITPNIYVDGLGGVMMVETAAVDTLNPYAPWKPGMEVETLPVYYNDLAYDWYEVIINIDIEQLRQRVRQTAEILGMDMETLVIEDDTPTGDRRQSIINSWKGWSPDGGIPAGVLNPRRAFCQQNGIRIEAQVNSITITFDTPVPMAEGAAIEDASESQRQLAADWISTEFADLLGESTQVNVNCGDPTLTHFNEGDTSHLSFYRPSETDSQAIFNYYFNRVNFYGQYDIRMIRIFTENLSKPLGEYPIITVDQAKERLLAGEYVGGLPTELPLSDEIIGERVELVYRTSNGEKYFLPYYQFFVMMERNKHSTYPDGMESYTVYYVPALQDEYLSDVTLWDGSFN